jgi:hypothetical protein
VVGEVVGAGFREGDITAESFMFDDVVVEEDPTRDVDEQMSSRF